MPTRGRGSEHLQFVLEGGLTLRDCEGGAPLVPQNIETDTAIGVDIGMVDSGGEVDLRRLERVVGGEVNGKEEDTPRVRRVGL